MEAREKTYFEQQREAYISEIAMVSTGASIRQSDHGTWANRPRKSFEHVLANINKLNRSLEAVITVGFTSLPAVDVGWTRRRRAQKLTR